MGETFHKMPDGSLMADKDMGEFKKGGKVKKKKCPKGKRRSKKTGKCQVYKKKLKSIPERRPSGTTGTLTADSAGQFGSGGMAQEARIARLQNLVDTQSSNLSHSALQKHLVALGYRPVPEIERDQRYMGDVLDSVGAKFAGLPGGNEENLLNGDPYSADRNRLRVQKRWEAGQAISRGALRQALHEDAWEGENIVYAPRADDNTHADEAFLASYGHGQAFFDDMGMVDDLIAQRNRDPYDRENAYFDQEEDQEFGAGRHTNRERRRHLPSDSSSESSLGGPGGNSGGRNPRNPRDLQRTTSNQTIVRGAPFGNPTFQYNRGRDEQPGPPPPDRNIGVGPWAYVHSGESFQGGDESVEGSQTEDLGQSVRSLTEEGTLVGSNISGAEPQRFGEQVYGGAQYAGGLAYDAGAVAGRLGLDIAGGAGGAVYDRLPSARNVGETVTGGALDLAGGMGRAMYNRLPEGPNMDQFLNDASGLVQDSGDNQRGGMRQQPGSEIMGRRESVSSLGSEPIDLGIGSYPKGVPPPHPMFQRAQPTTQDRDLFGSGLVAGSDLFRGRDEQPQDRLRRRQSFQSSAPSSESGWSELSRPDTEEISAVDTLRTGGDTALSRERANQISLRDVAKVDTFFGRTPPPARDLQRLKNQHNHFLTRSVSTSGAAREASQGTHSAEKLLKEGMSLKKPSESPIDQSESEDDSEYSFSDGQSV